MKSVIIIDASPMFQEFLKDKLTDEGVSVTVATGQRDAFAKTLSILPDLIIIDFKDDFATFIDFLQRKHKDPNAKKIPVIVAGPNLPANQISILISYGISKYFTTPIKFDVFFESVGQILRITVSMDITPCVLDIHRNGNLIFIEIAKNLNREKIALLKYKLAEIIEAEKLTAPKIVLMMTNLDLSFVDTVNIELLLDNILSNNAIKKKNVKILSLDDFMIEIIDGHEQYNGIEVADNLPNILNSIVDANASSSVSDLITDKILTPIRDQRSGSIETRFHSDSGVRQDDEKSGTKIRVAVVDDDKVTTTLLSNAFSKIGAECDKYSSGAEFMIGIKKHKYDLVILDIFMPGISGLDILQKLRNESYTTPIIVYSQGTQKEAVIQALSLGAKHFLIKSQKPEELVQKAVEVLNENV